jgi:hypothetical protein
VSVFDSGKHTQNVSSREKTSGEKKQQGWEIWREERRFADVQIGKVYQSATPAHPGRQNSRVSNFARHSLTTVSGMRRKASKSLARDDLLAIP